MRVQRLESIAAIATIVAFEAMLLLLSVTVCHVPASQEETPEEAGTPVSSIEFEQPVMDNSSRQYSIDEVKSIRWSYFYEWKKERL